MPFFSVIIPTYNRAHLISTAIRSVLDQRFEDYEIIVVDDGSTDDTKKIITNFNEEKIKYVHQQNGERGKARNTGVKHAKGRYVFFLDSDDMIYPQHLERAHQQLNQLNFPAFFHSRYEELKGGVRYQNATYLSPENIQKSIHNRNQFACQFFLRLDVAKAIPFSENRLLKIGEDWEVILKVAARYPLHILNEVTAAIIHHGNRSMEEATAQEILTSKKILIENLSADSAIKKTTIKKVDAELTWLASLSAAIYHKKGQALKLWFHAFYMQPSILYKRRTFAIFKKIVFGG